MHMISLSLYSFCFVFNRCSFYACNSICLSFCLLCKLFIFQAYVVGKKFLACFVLQESVSVSCTECLCLSSSVVCASLFTVSLFTSNDLLKLNGDFQEIQIHMLFKSALLFWHRACHKIDITNLVLLN